MTSPFPPGIEPAACIMGMLVYINDFLDNKPRMQLSEEVCKYLTPEFIAETNAWMKNFFGVSNEVMIFTDPDTGGKSIYVGPNGWDSIKRSINKLNGMDARYGK